jgi:hypothetical protein
LATRSFRNLERRVNQLGDRFLPQPNPIGTYSDKEYDFVRAYIVLAHAEIEEYLETRAKDIVSHSVDRWKTRYKVNRCIASLLLRHDSAKTPSPRDSASHIHCAAHDYEKSVVRTNHGIKEENVIALFSPLGLDKAEIPSSLLIELSNFGSARGKVAHTSARHVRNPPDPHTFLNQLQAIMTDLEGFDSLTQLLRNR